MRPWALGDRDSLTIDRNELGGGDIHALSQFERYGGVGGCKALSPRELQVPYIRVQPDEAVIHKGDNSSAPIIVAEGYKHGNRVPKACLTGHDSGPET